MASSRIRTSGSRSKARANATSCRSPAEKLEPRSVTSTVSAVEPVPRRASARSSPTRLTAESSCASVYCLPSAMFSASVPANRITSCETTVMRSRSVASGRSRISTPPSRTDPLSRS